MGQSPDSSGYNTSAEGLPLIQGNADIDNRVSIIRTYTRHITKKATTGDLLLTVRAPVGNIARATFNCCLGRGVCALRNAPNFLYYYFESIEGKWAHLSGGSTFDSINADVLESMEILLPPPHEQRLISASLDAADKYISALQALISKYDAIKKATVNLLMKPKSGWRQISLGDIGDVLMCKRILKNQTTETGDVPFYKIGTFGRTPDAFISRVLFDDFKARFSYPQKGDVLLSAAGTIGRTIVFNGEDAYFQDSNIVWIDNDERIVTNRFLHVLYGQLDWQTENGGTVSRLYNANIRNTKIKIPSLSEQKRIVGILDSIDGTINGLKSQLAKAQDIKQGMMSYFFG